MFKVYKGSIMYPMLRVDVAVKTCTRTSGYDDIEREARVFMKLTERHMNIVNLLGNVTYYFVCYLIVLLKVFVFLVLMTSFLCSCSSSVRYINGVIFEQIDTDIFFQLDSLLRGTWKNIFTKMPTNLRS